MAEPAFSPGDVVDGKYSLVSKLGEGGMGAVWRADHLTLNAPVAVKLLDPAIAKTEEGLARFMREAQAAAALRGAHVVQIFDYGVHLSVPFIVMELLVGESLADRLSSRGPMPPAEVAMLLKQVARAIGKAHQQGIVHRDLKPDNIFLVESEDNELVAKVLDFGIAKSNHPLGVSTGSKTRTGALLGTPYYMSPEQAQGTAEVDYRSDLWALAVITFECILGKRPFDSEALGDLLLKICAAPIPVPSKHGAVPAGFDDWFARAAAREPTGRFGTAAEMAKAFEYMLDPNRVGSDTSLGGSLAASRVRIVRPASDTPLLGSAVTLRVFHKGNRKVVGASVAAGLITLIVVVALLAGGRKEAREGVDTAPAAAPAKVEAPAAAPAKPVAGGEKVEPPPVAPSSSGGTTDGAKQAAKAGAVRDEKKTGTDSKKRAKAGASSAPAPAAAAPAAPAPAAPAPAGTPFDPLQMRR